VVKIFPTLFPTNFFPITSNFNLLELTLWNRRMCMKPVVTTWSTVMGRRISKKACLVIYFPWENPRLCRGTTRV